MKTIQDMKEDFNQGTGRRLAEESNWISEKEKVTHIKKFCGNSLKYSGPNWR
jgi:hypothetical protein